MKNLVLNETPVRTSKNFGINNIVIEEIDIPQKIKEFDTLNIINENSNVDICEEPRNFNLSLKYGTGDILINQIEKASNKKIRIQIDREAKNNIELDFLITNKSNNLIEDIEIIANENSKANIIIKYYEEGENISYHNGLIRILLKKNSNINVNVINLLNENANNFLAIENTINDNASLNYTIVDFGGKNSITNYYSNLIGDMSKNVLNTIYIGRKNQLFDLNYIGELRGKKSNIDIDVQGALTQKAKKHFKGTIDFKNGCQKAVGNENEFCILLSDEAKSLALPMLLCSEEDVEGNHSSAAGKVDEKQLFYIMSRGFSQKEAMKLVVRARFNNILEKIEDKDLKEEILMQIDKRLD